MSTTDDMRCEKCLEPAPWRTQVDDEWVGPCCVPDEIWAMYPGWRDREALRVKRAEQAKRNFGHGREATA